MKLVRIYIITVIAVASITAFAASVFIADENARRITLGETAPVISAADFLDFLPIR